MATNTATRWAWRCQECGHTFRSAAAAEKACFGDGCPSCGGTDFDESLPLDQTSPELTTAEVAHIRKAEAETEAFLGGGR